MNRAVDQKMTPNSNRKLTPVCIAYTTVSRKLEVPRALGSRTDRIPKSAHRRNQRDPSPSVNFRAQAADVRFNHVGVRVEIQIPYVFEQHGPGHHLAQVTHEVFEQSVLARLQIDEIRPAPNGVGQWRHSRSEEHT